MNEEKEIIIDEVNNKKEPLFEAEVTYTEEIYKNTYKFTMSIIGLLLQDVKEQ